MAAKPSKKVTWDEAFAYVGRFLWHWASLERELRRALQASLELGALQSSILSANVQLRDKLNILKTVLDLYGHEKAPGLVKTLNNIGTFSSARNMMAHEFFGVTGDEKAVEFFTTKAKGKLDLPSIRWREAEFEAAYDKINRLKDEVKEGMEAFKRPRASSAFLNQTLPIGGLFGLGSANALSPHFQGLLGFPSPKPQTKRKKPPSEKE